MKKNKEQNRKIRELHKFLSTGTFHAITNTYLPLKTVKIEKKINLNKEFASNSRNRNIRRSPSNLDKVLPFL